MARHSQDREDLLRDATALVPRLMLRASILGEACDVFAGFRGTGLSLYFGGDPVYHFNTHRELRRAFVNDHIIKAVNGDLLIWLPDRTRQQVAMLSRLMTPKELACFAESLSLRLEALRAAIDESQFELVGQFPENSDVLGKVQTWLRELKGFFVAQTANVK